MTRFRYYTATTLDGFLADEHDDLGWLLSQPHDEDGFGNMNDFGKQVGTVVMGATTYQWLLDNELSEARPWPYTEPSFVFTHREITPVADSIRVVAGSPSEFRDELVAAADGKDVWVVGGGDLAAQFADAGMLDEIEVSIAPVTLGSGRPLFTRPFDLELIEYGRNAAFLCARYAVKGARDAGSRES
ncbi:dihydrofolate reductase [Gordonia desulfuricans]|uniref:Dihydrofolate reductase n=1 Tax=Gordonia desulfuricans TaxID=89051 RepID=A0A7K3LLA6_9ACTN|nr:dihydrofolate reductase family protein [Gordonia desulfuricans]NDK89014.1 dihydrofolate reductase [Gordonia desulfuricans]